MTSSFFEPDGTKFRATELTRGPWSNEHMHGGPPVALMVRQAEKAAGNDGMRIAQVAVRFVRQVPIAPLTVTTKIIKPGKRVRVFEVVLSVDGESLLRAEVERIRQKRVPLIIDDPVDEPLRAPEQSRPIDFPFFKTDVGYHTAIEMRAARGTFGHGALAAWLRPRHRLLPDEAWSPAQRVMLAADSGNGVSCGVDWSRYLFINPDLTVNLFGLPDGEWVGVDARTIAGRDGIGLAESVLHDKNGPIGRGTQTLYLDEVSI